MIRNVQREQQVHRFKAKTLISLCTNETTQTTVFSIDSKNFLTWRQPMQPVFHNNINRFMYFPQKRHLQCFLFRIKSNTYVYVMILLTQEVEHNKLFRQLSVEFDAFRTFHPSLHEFIVKIIFKLKWFQWCFLLSMKVILGKHNRNITSANCVIFIIYFRFFLNLLISIKYLKTIHIFTNNLQVLQLLNILYISC